MLRHFIILIVFVSTALPVTAQTTLLPDGVLANPNMLVAELPDRLIGWVIGTDQGTLTYTIDEVNRRLLYQYAGQDDIQSVLLPLRFNLENANEVIVAPDGLSATFCNHPNTSGNFSPSVAGDLFEIDFSRKAARYAGSCHYDLTEWGKPPVSYSGSVESPDGEYTVSVVQGGEVQGCVDEVLNTQGFVKHLVIQSSSTSKKTACILADGISFEKWVDNRHLAVRLYAPHEINAPISQLLVLSVGTGELLSLGTQYEHYFPTMHFFDHNTKLARIVIREDTFKPDYGCALNIVDFRTLSDFDVEPTTCIHKPEIDIDEIHRQLGYLHYQIQESLFTPQISIHRVDLDTYKVTSMSISGTLMDIGQWSPTGDKVTLVVDQGDTYWYAIQDVVEFDNPRWVVYDTVADTEIYEKPLLEIKDRYDSPLYYGHIGAYGFIWTDTGWRTLLLTDDKEQSPLYIASENNVISETRLERIPPSDSYRTLWSPDHTQLFIQAETNAGYVLNAADQTVEPVFQPFDPGDLHMNVVWQDNRLLVEFTARGSDTTQGRWLIDPMKA